MAPPGPLCTQPHITTTPLRPSPACPPEPHPLQRAADPSSKYSLSSPAKGVPSLYRGSHTSKYTFPRDPHARARDQMGETLTTLSRMWGPGWRTQIFLGGRELSLSSSPRSIALKMQHSQIHNPRIPVRIEINGGALEGDLFGRRGAKHAHCGRPGWAVGERRRDPGGGRVPAAGRRLQAEGRGGRLADHLEVAGAGRLLGQGRPPSPEAPSECDMGPELEHGGVLLRGRPGRRERRRPPLGRDHSLTRVTYWGVYRSRGCGRPPEGLLRVPRIPGIHHSRDCPPHPCGNRGTHRVAHHAVLVISPYRCESILDCMASSIRSTPIGIYCHFSPLSDESILRSEWPPLILWFKPVPLGVRIFEM